MPVMPLTISQIRAGLQSGYSLGPAQFTYSVPRPGSFWETSAGNYGGENQQPFTGYSVLTADQADAFRSAITAWDRLISPNFVEVTDNGNSHGEVRAAFTSDQMDPSTAGYAFYGSNQTPTSIVADIWLNSADSGEDFQPGTVNFLTLLHEVGHVLGLKHPFEGTAIPQPYDDTRYTVMSYSTPIALAFVRGAGGSIRIQESLVPATTPQVLDIAAVQDMYGADPTASTGNDTYFYSQTDLNTRTIYDAGGIDTLDVSNVTRGSIIDLRPGSYSSVGFWPETEQIRHYATATGLSYAQVETYFSRRDYYEWVDNLGIAFNTTIENAIAGAGNDVVVGNDGNNVLMGGGGNDTLIGLGGQDTLFGGSGDDTFFLDQAGDSVFEAANEGHDTVAAGFSYTLAAGAYVELLTTGFIAGTAAIDLTGNETDNQIWGNSASNVLSGGEGNDALFGFAGNDTLIGGSGSDAAYGGTGDDTYFVDSAADVVVEAPGEGYDTVAAGFAYSLPTGASVELMTTGFIAGTAAIDLTGNELANQIWGNDGGNVLAGGGGDDALIGFGGNDTLQGGAGNDALFGLTGADAAYGGAGDDTIFLDQAGDRVFEAAGEGRDTVAAGFSYTLEGGAHVELLTTGFIAGTAAIDLTGNELGNELWGNAAGNVLGGGGGNDALVGFAGNDTLTGGAGADALIGNDGDDTYRLDNSGDVAVESAGEGRDTFVFLAAPGSGSADRIIGFAPGSDRIALDDAVFAGLAGGSLAASAFATGQAAQDASDRIIYDPVIGGLWFDADGTGATAARQFATLDAELALAAADFMVI